nr:BLUF domain-containing protein [uncultured Halomonas sp.]
MDKTLYRLVYLSRNTITGDDDRLQDEIRGILDVSQRNNRQAGVTGALMFNTGCFAQVLEGPHNRIQDTFERIQCDPRHSHVSVLAFDRVEARYFSDWDMAFVGQNAQSIEQFADFNERSSFDAKALDGDTVFELLRIHLDEAERA